MKYTRYDYKKKNKDLLNLTIVLVSVLVIAFLLGTGIYSIFIKPVNDNKGTLIPKMTESTKSSEVENNTQEVNSIKFIAIQSGFFKSKENADVLKNSLKAQVIPFTITEGDSIRIIAGVFSEEDSERVIQNLNQNGIPNTKTIFDVNKNDLCNAEIAEIVSGNIKILTKLTEKDVSAVQTDDFKNWMTTSMQNVDAKSKNYSSLEEYKNYINGLPKELSKDKVEENYVFIYNLLKKITTN